MIYIDDILVTSELTNIADIRRGLAAKRKIKELLFERFLRYNIIREENIIFIN